MRTIPDPAWPVVLLAGAVFLDAVLSSYQPKFIRDCLDGVGFPRDWWWALVLIKLLAVSGLVAGLWVPGLALAANVGVVAYFLAAGYSHVRARFMGQEFWLNCLGMLALAVFSLVVGFWA
jgi:hypothetical protein